jgi:putative peptidoglycan lipid II flippase
MGAAALPLLLAGWFGRSPATDLYTLFSAVFVLAGALVFACFQDSALVPVLIDQERNDPPGVPRFVGAVLAYTLLLAAAVAVLLAAGAFVYFRAHAEASLRPLLAPLAAGFALYLLLLALRSLASTLLAARFHFVTDAVGVAAGALTTVGVAAVVHHRGLGAVPFALAAGELVAGGVLFFALARRGLRARLNLRRSPPLRRLARLVAAEIGGAAVVRVNPLVDQVMAQALGVVGGGTLLRLSGDLGNAAASLLGALLLSILLSHLTVAGADGDRRAFRQTLNRSLFATTALLSAAALGAFVFRAPLVRLSYGRGAMDAAGLARIADILPFHLLGLAPMGALLVLARAHVSLGNSRILLGMGALNAGLNLLANVLLAPVLGLEGIALSTSLVNLMVAGVFWWRLDGVLPAPPVRAELG